MTTAEEAEVRQIEGRRFEAIVRCDFAEIDRILADDLTYTHSSGRLETKAQFLAALQSGLRFEAIEPEEVLVRVYGDAGLVTGRAQMRVRSQDRQTSFAVRFTTVYVKRQGRWQMVAWQSTRLPEQ